jgi:anion-transporting  ArsA/GET3 family ATPase
MATICSQRLTEAPDRLAPAVQAHPLGRSGPDSRRDWRCNTPTGKLSQPEERQNDEALGPPPVRLHRALKTVEDRYDIIVMDTPPSLGMLALNAIAAANLIVMPIVPHMYDISSSVQYFRILEQVCALYEREINVQRLNILLTKVDASTETLNNIAVINGAYGELILSNRMGLTKELQKSASDQVSIYEIDQPRGSRDTYNRAIMMLDGVNAEILLAVRQLWQQEILSGIEAAKRADEGAGMSRRKSLKVLGDWIGAGGHSFDGSLENEATPLRIQSLDLDQLVAGRYQPRQRVDEAYLAELAQSIRQLGVIEPLVARPLADGSYEILAGHMRWRAAQQAGLTQVPVVRAGSG